MLTSRRAGGADSRDPLYSARGNATTIPQPNDPEETFTCVYDAWNRLVEVVDDSTPVARYRYDGLNRRVRKLTDIDEAEDKDCTVTEYYYNSGWQLLEVRKQAEVSIYEEEEWVEPAVASYKYEQYVWSGRYIDAPVLRRWNSTSPIDDNTFDATYYYTTDANMNVTAEIGYDETWLVVERYVYTPYGEVSCVLDDWTNGQTAARDGNPILYCGYYRDAETGLYHVRRRPHHAELGRWLTRDPIGYADGMSLYAAYFVPGGVDPRGLEKVVYGVGPGHHAFYGPTMWDLFWRAIHAGKDSTYYRLTVGTHTTACGGGYRLATSKCGCKYDIVVKKRFVDRIDDAYAPTWGPNDECKMLKWLVNEARSGVGVICPGNDYPNEPVRCLRHLPEDASDWALRSRNDWAADQLATSAQQAFEADVVANSVAFGAQSAALKPLASYPAASSGSPSSATAYRYVNADEAAQAARTGRVPNVNQYGDPKSVYVTPEYHSSASAAKSSLQLDTARTHRIAVDVTTAKPTYAGNVAGSPTNSIEMTVEEQLAVKSIRPLEP